jgi:DNA-binding NarL/FixJ family response regulator
VNNDDGREVPAGVGVAERTNPEVAIVDAAMPGIDGVETIRRLLIAVPPVQVAWRRRNASWTMSSASITLLSMR